MLQSLSCDTTGRLRNSESFVFTVAFKENQALVRYTLYAASQLKSTIYGPSNFEL